MKKREKSLRESNVKRPLSEERRRSILKRINSEGRVIVSDLADEFETSSVTIRNDLKVLSEDGLLERTHGGAVRKEPASLDRSLSEKEKLHAAEKAAIAQKADSLIHEGQSVILDSGSTSTQIARVIRGRKNLTIITNAVNIALELMECTEMEVILTGGVLRRNSYSMVGHLAESALRQLTADLFFLGVDGIDEEIGYTTPNLAEARVNQTMMSISRETYVVSDSTKFGKRSLAVICQARAVRGVITDSNILENQARELEALGVEVIQVDVESSA